MQTYPLFEVKLRRWRGRADLAYSEVICESRELESFQVPGA